MSDEQEVSVQEAPTEEAPKQDVPEQDAPAETTTAAPTKKPASPAVVIAAIIALLAFLGYMAFQSFGPIKIGNLFPEEDQGMRVERLATGAQGDYNKLSPEDKKWMDGISRGNGDKYLSSAYKAIQTKGATK